ncbi:MAG: DUF3445 domain-containing protein [Methylococcaceae bacterium]|nr:MAG: DUF3445 domain-containing protein [Methylococcaceae bacterium]
MAITLPATLEYFPVQSGPFEFRTGLRALKDDPSSPGERLFQIDGQWLRYRAEKLAARRERFDKYVCRHQLSPAIAASAARFVIQQICREWPDCFTLEQHADAGALHCHISGERLYFDRELVLTGTENGPQPPYRDALDALCCQLQEDFSITRYDGAQDAISYLHLCLPNYWAAADKIGLGFLDAHTPVPGMERINRQAGALIAMLMERGPFERFTWGLTSDPRLNHHPEPPPGIAVEEWRGRRFDPAQPQLWLRIERQVTAALPEVNGFIFTIRTYLRGIESLNREELHSLSLAIETMPDAVSRYKGLDAQRREMLGYLQRLMGGWKL